MKRSRSRFAVAALFAVLVAPLTSAQIHKDEVRGFQFKPPREFTSVALSPGEKVTVAKYQSEQTEASSAGNYRQMFAVKFLPIGVDWSANSDGHDQYEEEDDEQELTADSYVEMLLDTRFAEWDVEKNKKLKVARSPGRELHVLSESNPLGYFFGVIQQEDGLFVFEGTALGPRFDKAARDFAKATKSFKRIDKIDTTAREAELAQMSEQERFLAEQEDKLPPGWDSMRTERYVFLFNAEKNFVKELAARIESMRDEYERLYPPDRPIEAVSIVRVCNSKEEYHAYGGPPGSAGYWYYVDQELVFYDAAPRDTPMLVANHEAFHQYIFYFYGQLAPHSWYNEGHGDYFAGAKLTRTHRITGYGKFVWRIGVIKEAARLFREGKRGREGACAPLKLLMRFHRDGFYGSKGYDRGVNYATGWALVHMLREAKGQEDKWKLILPEYLDNLLASRHEVAVALMEKELAAAEKKEEGSSEEESHDPEDFYTKVSVTKVQDLAYDKTFSDWTDDDWEEFQDFFLEYVEKL
jgi:hypothetical protein